MWLPEYISPHGAQRGQVVLVDPLRSGTARDAGIGNEHHVHAATQRPGLNPIPIHDEDLAPLDITIFVVDYSDLHTSIMPQISPRQI